MYCCPHCQARSITVLAKLCSGSASPACCPKCDGLSFVRTDWYFGAGLAACAMLCLAALVSFGLGQGWLLAAGLGLFFALPFYVWHRTPLARSSPAQVAAGRPFAWAVLVAAAVGVAATFMPIASWIAWAFPK